MVSEEVNKSQERKKSVVFKEENKKRCEKIELIQCGKHVGPKQMLELIQHLKLSNLNLSVVFSVFHTLTPTKRVLART